MSTHNNSAPRILLIPGAWMGGWIWEPTVDQLRDRGLEAATLTLEGLEPEASDYDISHVPLERHVTQVANMILEWPDRPVVLVGHSYSGMVVGQVADRLPDRVSSSIHFDSFLPIDGRSLIDDWGPDEPTRAQERADIENGDGHPFHWAAPPPQALELEPGLTPQDRTYLSERFTPHPGHTVLDPAHLDHLVTHQKALFVASTATNIPHMLRTPDSPTWDIRVMESGHWPMLERPQDVVDLITEHVESLG